MPCICGVKHYSLESGWKHEFHHREARPDFVPHCRCWTLAARRWGETIAGWVVGLPLTSGPTSVFFALEQGPAFAAEAAVATLLGLVATAAFFIGYILGTRSSHKIMACFPALRFTGIRLGAVVFAFRSGDRCAPGGPGLERGAIRS
jgi:hypothetical protein